MNYSDTYQLFMDWNFEVLMDIFDNLKTVYQDQGYLNHSGSSDFVEMLMNNINLNYRRGGNKSQKKISVEKPLCDHTEKTQNEDD